MLWLYLSFPKLQLERTYLSDSVDIPIVIIDRKLNEIVQLNHYACQAGITKGMGLASALAQSSDLKVEEYDKQKEESELKSIARDLYQYTGDIVLDAPHGLYLPIDTMLKLYRDLNSYWQHILNVLLTYNVTIQYATGYSAIAAKVLAKSDTNKILDNKQQISQLINDLPIAFLNLAPKTIEKFVRIGIKQIHQLLAIPLKELAIRFDIETIAYIGQLKGEIKNQFHYYRPPPYFVSQLELLFEIGNSTLLIKPINNLVKKLELFLIKRCLTTQEVVFHFKQENGNTFLLTIHSAKLQHIAEKWLYLVELKLENLVLTSAIRSITLTVKKLTPQQATSVDMFSGRTTKVEKAEFISILQAKLGKDAVLQPTYTNEHLPENSTILSPLKADSIQTKSNSVILGIRPSHLFTHPLILKEPVNIQSAPERIKSGWWKNNYIERDYFLAQNSNQQWYWVFRQPDKKWFIHGYFG